MHLKWHGLGLGMKPRDRLKILEWMMISGGILSAFKITGWPLGYYILSLTFSLIYLVVEKSALRHRRGRGHMRLISVFIAVGFAGVLGTVMLQALAVLGFLSELISALLMIGMIVVLYAALT